MRSIITYTVTAILIALTISASAQVMVEDTTTNQPFFKARKFDSKCYVGAEGMVSEIIKTRAAMHLGLSLNWVINHKFVVTARYMGITTPINVHSIVEPGSADSVVVRLNHHFAGLGFSYIVFNNKMFSLQPELTAGWADIKYTVGTTPYRRDFGEIIPAVYGVYNCTKYFRFGLGLSYRIAVAAKLSGLTSADISGVSGIFFIRVGTF